MMWPHLENPESLNLLAVVATAIYVSNLSFTRSDLKAYNAISGSDL